MYSDKRVHGLSRENTAPTACFRSVADKTANTPEIRRSMEAKVALVTGASSGIGAHLALALASVGYSLSLMGRNRTALQETSDKCAGAGLPRERILQVAGDVRLEEAVESAIYRTVEKFGRLDLLLNSAGVTYMDDNEHFSMEIFDRIFDTNVRAVFYFMQQALPHLSRTEGSIINLSAGCADSIIPPIAVYCASKIALNSLTMSMALEVAPRKVRINGISLGPLPTGIHQRSNYPEDLLPILFHEAAVPLLRTGTLDDVSHAALFLANNTQSSYITGMILPLLGGSQLYQISTVNP